jgi:hypothetical protein
MTMDTRELTEAERVLYEEEIERMIRRMKIEGGNLEDCTRQLHLLADFVRAQADGLAEAWRSYFTIPTMKYGGNVRRPLMLSNPTCRWFPESDTAFERCGAPALPWRSSCPGGAIRSRSPLKNGTGSMRCASDSLNHHSIW